MQLDDNRTLPTFKHLTHGSESFTGAEKLAAWQNEFGKVSSMAAWQNEFGKVSSLAAWQCEIRKLAAWQYGRMKYHLTSVVVQKTKT